MSYLYLILEALLPVAFAVGFKLLNHKTKFRDLPYWVKQVIYAIAFGGLAVFGTECGVVINEGVINVRDAPPIIAGLFFGAPAGIAAGLIGGIERLITGYFIAGRAATRVACSVATILAGVLAAVLRLTTRKGKKVHVVTASTLTFVIEVFHMLLVYLTNTDNLAFVIGIYRKVVGPMLVANVLSVFLATWADLLIDRYFAKEKLFKKIRDSQMSGAIQQATLLVALLTFAIGFTSINVIQTRIGKENIENTLNTTSKTVSSTSTSLVNYALGEYASDLAKIMERYPTMEFVDCVESLKKDPVDPSKMPYPYEGCFEGYVVTTNADGEKVVDKGYTSSFSGIVTTDPLFVDLMEKLEEAPSGKFNALEDLVPTRRSDVPQEKVLYSISLYEHADKEDYIILSMNVDKINNCIKRNQNYILYNQTYASGVTVVLDKDNNFIASTRNLISAEEAQKLLSIKNFDALNQIRLKTKDVEDDWYVVASETKLAHAYSLVTVDDAELPARVSMYSSSFLFTVSVGLIFLVANALIDRMIVRKMEKVGDALDQISGNNLDTRVNVYGFEEFNKLSTGINHTVGRLQGYIEDEKARINKDLDFAKSIQKGTLPYKFPQNVNYDLYADMRPARQVGGDFYDFFPLPNNRLFFLIADVSGKGVPAAMFMMRSETLIKSLVQTDDMSLEKVMAAVNNELCTNNDAQMFVTCWCGILDINTGHIEFANAGHNAPIVKRKDGKFEEIKIIKNFVLAGMENIPFRLESIDLNPGDEIFIYTDGVTEATDKLKQLYGIGRLLKFMNEYDYHTSKEMLQGIMQQLDEFQKGAEQADDITMLMIRFKPNKN